MKKQGIDYQRQIDGAVYVVLDGKRVGVIRLYPPGWQYKPRGGEAGDFFATLAECKKSLESDDE